MDVFPVLAHIPFAKHHIVRRDRLHLVGDSAPGGLRLLDTHRCGGLQDVQRGGIGPSLKHGRFLTAESGCEPIRKMASVVVEVPVKRLGERDALARCQAKRFYIAGGEYQPDKLDAGQAKLCLLLDAIGRVAAVPCYVIAYRVRKTAIDILAIIHGARRWPESF